jgi:DNA adenine methylase
MTYVEACLGGGSVLLNKKPSKYEYANDLDSELICLWQTVRDNEFLYTALSNIKYSEDTFDAAKRGEFIGSLNELILRRMSRVGLKKDFSWSKRLRGGIPGDVNAWNNFVKRVPEIQQRIKNVLFYNENAIQYLDSYNRSGIFAYADPPYLPETRTTKKAYDCEMTYEQHQQLGDVLNSFKGKVLLSGYDSPLYRQMFKNWTYDKKFISNHASQSKTKNLRMECLWSNY